MFVYTKLWNVMKEKNYTRNDLRNKLLSPTVIAKLGRNEKVSIDVIEKLCEFLNCQPGDIMEYVPDREIEKLQDKLAQMQSLIKMMQEKYSISDSKVQDISKGAAEAIDNGELPQFLDNLLHTDPSATE